MTQPVKRILMIACFVALSVAAHAQKIAYVQSDVILKQLPEALQADTVLKQIGTQWQDTLMTMQKQIQDKTKQLDGPITDDAKQKLRAEIDQIQQQGVAYQQEKFGQQGAYAQKQEELLTPIRDKVKKAIEAVAAEDKIDVVFDKASPAQDILFASDKIDITFKVLDHIKRGK